MSCCTFCSNKILLMCQIIRLRSYDCCKRHLALVLNTENVCLQKMHSSCSTKLLKATSGQSLGLHLDQTFKETTSDVTIHQSGLRMLTHTTQYVKPVGVIRSPTTLLLLARLPGQSLASPTPSAFMANMASASGRQGES